MTHQTTQYHADMSVLDGETDRLNGQFSNIMDSTSFPDKWKEVRECLEVLNKEIIVKKQGKFRKGMPTNGQVDYILEGIQHETANHKKQLL